MKIKTITTGIGSVSLAALPAAGVVVHTDLETPLTISAGDNLQFQPIEQDTGTSLDGSSFNLSFYDADSSKPQIQDPSGFNTAESDFYAVNFAQDDVIGAGETFSPSVDINNDGDNNENWAAGTRGYLGLSMEVGEDTFYGWADIEYTSGQQLTLYGFAYENSSDIAIHAGAILEPKTTALAIAALAAGSVLAFRRRKSAQNYAE